VTAEQKHRERKLSEIPPEELAEMLVDAEVAKRRAGEYVDELKAELLERVGRGQVLHVRAPRTLVKDEWVQPVGTVEVRHKSRSGLKYDEAQIIRLLKDQIARPAYVSTETRVVETLDRRAFEKDLFELPTLENLRKFVTPTESDWIEVRGLPK
jgi:hypothetical protein